MKILLLGKGGQVGWELQRSLASLGELVALDARSNDYCGDLLRPVELTQTVEALKPHVIVNAAAYTAVDKAESEPELARTVNALAPGALAKAAANAGALLVSYSTDYVFDGTGQIPWRETDTPAPLSVYGQTKWEGEQLIAQSGCQHLIFRTSWVYGARGGNFAKTMLRLAKERDSLSVIDDQFGAPTGADLLADISAHCIRQFAQSSSSVSLGGLYHVVAGGETSWHGYAQFVINAAQSAGVVLKATPQAIAAVPTSSYPTPARRPLNSRLNTEKFSRTFGLSLPHWQTGVSRMLAETL
jgi:dTDP-4-dehydrorhamnose reductase